VLTVASLTDEVEIVLISDANDAAHATYLSHNQIGSAVRYLNAREVGLAYQVSITPYGVVLDCEGIVRGSARCRDFTEVQALMQSVGLTLPEISLPLLASGATHHSPTAERTTT
jgi:methylamine dehydrogenase accessory protein MauD